MKKIDTVKKLKIGEIKRNPSSDVSHTIKKIKLRENKIVCFLVVTIVGILIVLGSCIFSQIQERKVGVRKNGPLVVKFLDDYDGMGDIITFTGNDPVDYETNLVVYEIEFQVENTSLEVGNYNIYLEDYLDMIQYDSCHNYSFESGELHFRVDDNPPKTLEAVSAENKYLLATEEIGGKEKSRHKILIWHNGYSTKHYHGKVFVEYNK